MIAKEKSKKPGNVWGQIKAIKAEWKYQSKLISRQISQEDNRRHCWTSGRLQCTHSDRANNELIAQYFEIYMVEVWYSMSREASLDIPYVVHIFRMGKKWRHVYVLFVKYGIYVTISSTVIVVGLWVGDCCFSSIVFRVSIFVNVIRLQDSVVLNDTPLDKLRFLLCISKEKKITAFPLT